MKKLLALLLVLVMVVALVACGGNDNETEAPTDASQPASDATENNDNTDNSDTPVGTDLKVAVFYYTYSDTYISSVRTALDALINEHRYGVVLRAKGIVPATDGGWIHFDYVPGESDVRRGSAQVTGRVCVIGSHLAEDALKELFHIG